MHHVLPQVAHTHRQRFDFVGRLEHLVQPLPAVSAVGMLPTEPPSGSREAACNRRFECVCSAFCNYYFSTLSVPRLAHSTSHAHTHISYYVTNTSAWAA